MSNLSEGNGEFASFLKEEEEAHSSANDPGQSSHRSQASDLGLSVQLGRTLKQKSKQLIRENVLLRQQTESQHKLLLRLSQVIQACEESTYLTERIEADLFQGKVMSPEEALSMTICSLKQQMEAMADERDDLIRKIIKLECQVEELEFQKEAHLCKIQVLESLHEENHCVDRIKGRANSYDSTEMASSDSGNSI